MATGERAYEKIINYVEQQVMQGRYKKGDKLPPERELAALLGASRNSVREGLGILERMGAISSQQGAGNFISVDTRTGIGYGTYLPKATGGH